MLTFSHSTNLAIILAMMQLAKKVPFEDPQVLMLVRGMYILSNVIILGIYLFTQTKINGKKGMWVFVVAWRQCFPRIIILTFLRAFV